MSHTLHAMSGTQESDRVEPVTFDDFRRLAADDSLSPYERIGFPDSYRDGVEEAICEDIVSKLPALVATGKRFLDIGAGCSGLPAMLLDLCAERGHEAVLVDSPEMLARLPERPNVAKVAGSFPDSAVPEGPFDAILAYSVMQYVVATGGGAAFLDRALGLLADGGTLLIGDVPNVSKRNRFFSSPSGVEFHKRFMDTDDPPEMRPSGPGVIDDSVVLDLLARARAAGFDAHVVPLRADLPLANRREDILIGKP